MEILRLGEMTDVPWKNGGGITRNIALATFGQRTAWRLSRADVAQDGAFSRFAGLERILTVVSPNSMALEHPHGVMQANPWTPVRFNGALDIHARLENGPLTDLNLMFDPMLCEGSVHTLQKPSSKKIQPPAAGMIALHVLAGDPVLDDVSISVGDTAFLDAPTMLTLAPGNAVLQITIRYIDQSSDITFSIATR